MTISMACDCGRFDIGVDVDTGVGAGVDIGVVVAEVMRRSGGPRAAFGGTFIPVVSLTDRR